MSDFTVACDNLRKVFDGPDGKPFDAVHDLTFSLRRGKISALVGPDGAGKTTLMRS